MSGRDYRHRETKKPKKNAGKTLEISILSAPVAEVEVVKKKKKREGEKEG